MPQPLKVLIAEDSANDAELMLRELRRAGFDPTWQRVETEAAFLEQLVVGLDVVLSDYDMGQFNAMRALELLKESKLEIPFILVSGTIGEETAVAVIRNGATDYLMKDRLGRLGEAVSHALEEFRLRRERRQADDALRTAHLQLGQMLKDSPAIVYLLKLKDDKVVPHLISENLTALLGFTVAEASSYEWWAGQLHPDDRERAIASVAETVRAGSSLTEYRLRHKDGHYCWVNDSRRSILDSGGKPFELVGVWMDITERKRAEEVMRNASSHVARDRKNQVRIELAMLGAVTVSVFLLAAHFEWFENGTAWILSQHAIQLDEMVLTTMFFVAGLTVFAFRRWRETESDLTDRHQAQAAMALLHDELDQKVKQRTGELERAGQSLSRGAEDFRLLFDRNPMPMWVYDLETLQFLAVNEAAMERYGYSKAEFLAMKTDDLRPSAASLLANVKPVKPVRPPPPPQTWLHRKKDGTVMHMVLTSHDIPFGDRRGQLVMAADETARQLAEEELRTSEAGYRTLFEYAPDGIVIADVHSAYLDANASICRMLGYSREEMIGLNACDIVVPAEIEYIESALSQINAKTEYHREWQFRRKDGSTFSAEVLATLMPDGNLMAMIRDVTQRKVADQKIRDQLDELLRWQEVMLNREDRVQALKTEVNEQLTRQGEPTRYAGADAP